ncbi:metal-dependent hydrolase [bacterium]|nr:metal-dependent hydrolase [bacterium]
MPDPITHLSIGYIVARHCYKDNKTLFLCSTIIPDIDGLTGLVYIFLVLPSGSSPDEMARVFQLFHPSLTASLFFLPVFAYIILLAFRLVNRKLVPQATAKAYRLILVAILIHLGLDMLMTGNRPFWPLAFEAGLPVIPYSIWGTIVPMIVALTLLAGDLLFLRSD